MRSAGFRSRPPTGPAAAVCADGTARDRSRSDKHQLRQGGLEFRIFSAAYLCRACLNPYFEPCIPTRGTKVPDRPEWIHEIKHDGYRLIVQREGKRVRLFTRNGHDWSDRYPLITEAALRNRNTSFVIDGEAVMLGVDGRSDFNGLHSRQHDAEVQFYAFDMLVSDGEDLRKLPLACARPTCPAVGAARRRHPPGAI